MQCVKMQGSTIPATILDLSAPHVTNSLLINANASGAPAHIPLTSGDSTIGARGQDDRCSRSSWIRRLKPREGGIAEAAPGILKSEEGASAERINVRPRSLQLGCFPQDKAAIASRVRPYWKVESVSDAKRRKPSEQQDCDVAERPIMDVCQGKSSIKETEKSSINESGKSVAVTATAPQSNGGFGPWVSLSSSRKPNMRSDSGLGLKNTVGTVTSSQESLKDVQGGSNAPPLSPIQGKLGLPPRPPSQKTPGFHSPSKIAPLAIEMGRGVFHQPNMQFSDAPLNREAAPARQLLGVQNGETSKFSEAASARSGSSFQNLKALGKSLPYCGREHGKGLSDCGQQFFASTSTSMGNSNLQVKQSRPSVVKRVAVGQLGSCSNGPAVQVEHGRKGVDEALHVKMSREGGKEAICADLLHLKVSGPAMEDSKVALKNGPLLQMASVEPERVALQQSPSGNTHGTSTSVKAAASASASATLPWEMFVEPAGAAKKAREQFVEVYNRARDELKNQRMFQGASAVEIDGGPKLTLGPGDTVSDHRVERQFMKSEQNSAGHLQVQGRLRSLSQTSEHHSLALASNVKEQPAISLAESKGPVSILANEQSGLHRDTALLLKSGSPRKQLEGFRQVQTLSEGQVSLSLKTVVQEGDQATTRERLDERSIVYIKGSRPTEKELVSKLNEDVKCDRSGQIARVSHQRDVDRHESIPALGKRLRATFEDHAMSRVADEGAVSQARPDVWLQRWHPTAAYNSKGLADSQVPSDGKRDDVVKYLSLGLKKFKDCDGVGAFSRVREVKDVVAVDKEKGVKNFKTNSLKTLPSAAAMAIVGTAARQFCSVQPQRKGSFAFWSGFGMPPPRKVEPPIQEKGKDRMFVKPDVNSPNC